MRLYGALIIVIVLNFNLTAQDYRDKYLGSYQCSKKMDIDGSISWKDVEINIDKDENDTSVIFINDTSFYNDNNCMSCPIDYYGRYLENNRFTIFQAYGGYCDFYQELDSLYLFINILNHQSHWVHYHYYGKKEPQTLFYQNKKEGRLAFYPNPASEQIHFYNLAQGSLHDVEIFNLLGQKQIVCLLENGIRINDLKNGVYIITVTYSDKSKGIGKFQKY